MNTVGFEEVVATGNWGPNTSWEIILSDVLPPAELCTAVACVAITNLANDEVVMTQNQRGLEVLAGHVDDIQDGPSTRRETLEEAMRREAEEEGGFIISEMIPFGYRKITAHKRPKPGTREEAYPFPLTYIPYSIAFTDLPLLQPSGQEIIRRDTYTLSEIEAFTKASIVDEMELTIIKHGLAFAHKLQV